MTGHPRGVLRLLVFVLTLVSLPAGRATAQCILANPSFEIPGSGGPVFGGWNEFGDVGTVTAAAHGSRAARVSGPDSGDWGVSGFWQGQDCVPGERWDVTGHVQHAVARPLTGPCTAFVSVEWRDGAGAFLADQITTVADAATPAGVYGDFSFVSDPAPAGTATVNLILCVLQGPTDPSPDVIYDQVTFFSTGPPTIDDVQWNDFPGGRTVFFGGRTWRVKGPGLYGPGSNLFCDASDCVWVDAQDRLHLTLQQKGGPWFATEVVTEEALGYGDYILTTVGRLDEIDPQAVLGIFLWQYGPCWDPGFLWWNPFNEIDIEYSRWGDPASDSGQFVAQPYDWPGNISRFEHTFGAGEVVSHAMRWLADRVEYRVWRGGAGDESPANLIHAWTYTGFHVPRPEQPRLHLNLWRFDGTPAADQEVVFQDFVFVPEGAVSAADGGGDRTISAVSPDRLFPASPNPFNPRTTMRFVLDRGGAVDLAVHDLHGRRLRTLASGYREAGEYEATWDGRDAGGRPLASGVYLFRLRGTDFTESRRVTLVR